MFNELWLKIYVQVNTMYLFNIPFTPYQTIIKPGV